MVANRLEMRGISLAFGGVRALSRVEFTLRGGSVHALTGANGAGKSTLMAVLCGTHARYEGEIIINNQPVSIRTPHQAKQLGIHLVQQEVDVALVPGLSIAENILLDHLAQPGYRFRWAEVRRRAADALAQLDAGLDVRRAVDSCTLAEKQQILLARALSHRCRFLILDEPTAPLDARESERLFAVVRRLREQGIGIVFISHRIHELRGICDTRRPAGGERADGGPERRGDCRKDARARTDRYFSAAAPARRRRRGAGGGGATGRGASAGYLPAAARG